MINDYPRITFGMIVLNGEPFIRYNLRSLYPFAHEIIVVEGAAPAAAAIATPDGHSSDDTLEIIHRFQSKEDQEQKVILVTAEDEGYPNGFWPGEKDEMSQAYVRRVTGNYLWQVDSDEFYLPKDISTILCMLRKNPSITTISFPMITFWGGFDYTTDGWFLHRDWCSHGIHRIFRWAPGFSYVNHRPPTVHDQKGRDLRSINWVKGEDMEKNGIYMYHYSLLFPKQVDEKCIYYNEAKWVKRNTDLQWIRKNYLDLDKPFRVHNVYDYPSWLERFSGEHPAQVKEMKNDIEEKRIIVQMRETKDIEVLLDSPWYRLGRFLVRNWEPFDLWFTKYFKLSQYILSRIKRKIKQFLRIDVGK